MIQERFDEMIALIHRNTKAFPFLRELLETYHSSVLIFSFFSKPSPGNSQQNVLALHETRSIIEQRRENYSPISSALLNSLRTTKHAYICVSIFRTSTGLYSIFSNFDRTELIGAFYSPEEPKEPPHYSHLFHNGRLLSRER